MSIETKDPGKPSRYLNDEGSQERREQALQSVQPSGRVSGDGMSGRATGMIRKPERSGDSLANISPPRQTCPRGAQAPMRSTTPATVEAAAARAGVGVPHSSDESPETGVERRRGSCATKALRSGRDNR